MKRALCLVVTMGVAAVGAQAAVTDSELSGFKKRLDPVRKSYEEEAKDLAEDLEKAKDALEVEKVKKEARPWQVGYLRFLLMLEDDLRLLAAPEDKVDESIAADEFSTQEKRKVASLRQEIREAERERIQEELKEGRGMHSEEKIEKSILRDEMSLDSIYDRNVSKLKREIEKAQRTVSKEQDEDDPDEERIEELEKQLEKWEEEIAATHRYVYGFELGAGFEREADASDSSAAGKFLAELVAERDKVLKVLRGEDAGGEGEKKGGMVGGSFLYSSNLGVVLDVSGSMTPHIEKLKKEIANTFAAPRYREIKGCRLSGRPAAGLSLPSLSASDTMLVVEDLVAAGRVDTVYWFCDLRDGYDLAAIRRLRQLLRRGGSAFHVKSMAMRPERELKPLIDDFQG